MGLLFFNATDIASLGLESNSIFSFPFFIKILAKKVPLAYFLINTLCILCGEVAPLLDKALAMRDLDDILVVIRCGIGGSDD